MTVDLRLIWFNCLSQLVQPILSILCTNNFLLYAFYAGSFEESVLNGRLEPVSTVQGFRAELGASGSFVPKHLVVPVTVFFYTLGDNDKVSSPYLVRIILILLDYIIVFAHCFTYIRFLYYLKSIMHLETELPVMLHQYYRHAFNNKMVLKEQASE